MNTLQETKETIRKRISEMRRQLGPGVIRESSAMIAAAVLRMNEFNAAGVVGAYMAMPREVQTMDLVYAASDMGKQVCVPAWNPEKELYEMARYDIGMEMISGPVGILEPKEADWVPPEEINVMLVPAIAFDPNGGRLGHGGGHYDRLLQGGACYRVGLAFEFQVVKAIPLDEHDVPVDVVVTERGTYPETG